MSVRSENKGIAQFLSRFIYTQACMQVLEEFLVAREEPINLLTAVSCLQRSL
jgi:hypothetical protein